MTTPGRKNMPTICWLRVTDYMHDWVTHNLSGTLSVKGQGIVCLQHMKGARDIMRMKIVEDIELSIDAQNKCLSAQRYRVISAGMIINENATTRLYGIDREALALYMPIECPPVCMTDHGVLREWTNNTCFTYEQATALQKLLRDTFFQTVTDYNDYYKKKMAGKQYPAIDMIEEFCDENDINDTYADTIRREWQRRLKRQ